jgi:ketosteroid isomerase-like protein
MLRAVVESLESPGEVLARVNEALVAEIPPSTFVTCFYGILEPESGRFLYANAGHNLPCRRRNGQAEELRARGMPLGLMPGMSYEEKEIGLEKGESVLYYSDGFVEAHDPKGEMFGFPRLRRLVAEHAEEGSLLDFLMDELRFFTGDGWEQVAQTIERAASNLRDGEFLSAEIIERNVTPELAYAVWLERTKAKVGGEEDIFVPIALRVTMIFRPEDGEWKIVHRHADPITTPQPAESVIQE